MAKRQTEDHLLAEFFAKFMIWGVSVYVAFIAFIVISAVLHII